ncbi:MAG: putative metal-binding motif-containing protein [Myxococcota bacterium]|nr:putative metal-binding motif-containing protein [Myxococcota bacterium]
MRSPFKTLVASLLLVGCSSASENGAKNAGPEDGDGDGVSVADGDCNDADDTIYPGADEIWDDGIDQDCDGEDTDSDVERCRDAIPCPEQILPVYNDWDAIAMCSSIESSIEYSAPDPIPDNCLQEVAGSITIFGGNYDRLDGLPLLTNIGGDLEIGSNPSVTVARFKRLETVGGVLQIGGRIFGVASGNDALTTASFPQLSTVEGEWLHVSLNPLLSSIELPLLAAVDGSLEVANSTSLQALAFESLETVSGTLDVSANSGLVSIAAPLLTETGESLVIRDNDALTTVDMPKATTVGLQFNVWENPSLQLLEMPSLVSTDVVSVMENDALESVVLNALETTSDSFFFAYNEQLTNLELGSFRDSGQNLTVMYNDSLCQSAVDDLLETLQERGWSGTSEQYTLIGNDDSC